MLPTQSTSSSTATNALPPNFLQDPLNWPCAINAECKEDTIQTSKQKLSISWSINLQVDYKGELRVKIISTNLANNEKLIIRSHNNLGKLSAEACLLRIYQDKDIHPTIFDSKPMTQEHAQKVIKSWDLAVQGGTFFGMLGFDEKEQLISDHSPDLLGDEATRADLNQTIIGSHRGKHLPTIGTHVVNLRYLPLMKRLGASLQLFAYDGNRFYVRGSCDGTNPTVRLDNPASAQIIKNVFQLDKPNKIIRRLDYGTENNERLLWDIPFQKLDASLDKVWPNMTLTISRTIAPQSLFSSTAYAITGFFADASSLARLITIYTGDHTSDNEQDSKARNAVEDTILTMAGWNRVIL
jgi:hypothetical protein